jgi:hypothetical protein
MKFKERLNDGVNQSAKESKELSSDGLDRSSKGFPLAE